MKTLYNNEKPPTEKLSEKERTICYLYYDSEIMILSVVLNYHFLIERLQRENNERRYTCKFSLRVCGVERVRTEIVPLSIVSPNGMNAMELHYDDQAGLGFVAGQSCAHRFRIPTAFPSESRTRAGDVSTFKESSLVSLVRGS